MIFKYPYTTRTTDCVYATEANRIEQYKKIIAVIVRIRRYVIMHYVGTL